MTQGEFGAYQKGFLAKCAEAGISAYDAGRLMKAAQQWNRGEYAEGLAALQDRLAAKENLNIKDSGLPGTWLGRLWRRATMGKDEFGRYYGKIVRENIADARRRQARDWALNQTGLGILNGATSDANANPDYMRIPGTPAYNAPAQQTRPEAPKVQPRSVASSGATPNSFTYRGKTYSISPIQGTDYYSVWTEGGTPFHWSKNRLDMAKRDPSYIEGK